MVSLLPEDDGAQSQWLPTPFRALEYTDATCPSQPEDYSWEDHANRKDFSGPTVFERRTVRHESLQHKQNADPRVREFIT